MIAQLPLSENLRESLSNQYQDIDLDKSGEVSLSEFLYFFLQYKPFRIELSDNFQNNQPYQNKIDLTRMQRARLFIYIILTRPNFNRYSKILYFIDLSLSFVLFITLLFQAICPHSWHQVLDWNEDVFLWCVSCFFAAQYVFAVALCKRKWSFITQNYHILELVSFLPFIIYKGGGYTGGDLILNAFVLFRVVRVFQLASMFPQKLGLLEENINIYVDTLNLAWTSYRGMSVFMVLITILLSTLVYAFERGEWIEDKKEWIRHGEDSESPFSNLFNCLYFSIVTGTTLGYGDMYPTSYGGKVISVFLVLIGLVNITFVINTIGDCFEEVFRGFLQERTRRIEEERANYILQNVELAQKKIESMKTKKIRKTTIRMVNVGSEIKALGEELTNDATSRENQLQYEV
jgi:hypothetical protein